jgi:eukaryotic-like serine/threonine-protein kinase
MDVGTPGGRYWRAMQQEPELIAGRFVVEQVAGVGGMGKVYRARDLVSGERVAVKVLRAESVETARFEREGVVLAELHHPAIVRYVAHGRTPEGSLYLAMEWLEGEDLSRRLKRRELTTDESVTVAMRVASALQEAHRRGVVHRDVKPGNVFLVDGAPERAKLLDFGIARVPGSPQALTHTGHMIGTPGFMAPEQTRGQRDIGPGADVFSLACVLFRCLAGRAPFIGEDVLATLLKVALEEAPRVRDFKPEVPEALDDLIARMLAKAPADRPLDGGAVARELARLLSPEVSPDATQEVAPEGEVTSERRLVSPPSSGVTTTEQRLLCVLVARAPPRGEAAGDTPTTEPQHQEGEIRALADRFGGRLHVLVDGSLFVTLGGAGAGTDQAIKAARCALCLRALLPGVPLSLVAGRAVLSGRVPMGEAIDRGVAMLDRGSGDEVRIDEVIAGLVDARFDVGSDAAGHYLRAERDPAEAPRKLLGKPTACLGRDAELSRLTALFDECLAEPAAQAVLVTAPPGVGKSRLCQELLRQVRERRPETQIWIGRADLMSAGSPFAMIGSAIRRAAQVHGGEVPALRQLKILARVGRRIAGVEQVRVSELLGEIAGGASPGRDEARPPRADARVLGDQLLRAWLAFVRAEASAGPILLVLEDLQWGDLPSVSFVDAALRELADLPILVVALARPEVREVFPRLWAERSLLEIKLGALSRRASERLVRRALGEAAAASVVDLVVSRGAGNAFYLEELIRAVAEGRGDRLPETVLAMAEARLDNLGPAARRVLRAASVFGVVFSRDGVAAVLGDADKAELGHELAELSRGEFIERHGVFEVGSARAEGPAERLPDEEFAFRHTIVRDAAYAMLTDADRAVGHSLAGTWLEVSGEDDPLRLAEHFDRGGQPARALRWYHRAAEQALEGSDLEGAIACAERAVACGASGEARGALLILEGEAHAWRDESAAASRCCAEAMSLLPRGSALWCEAAGIAVVAHVQLGELDRFSALAHALHEVDPHLDALDRYVIGSALVMSFLWAGGLYDVARSFLRRTQVIAGRAASPDAVVQGWLGFAECCRLKYEGGGLGHHLAVAEASVASFHGAGDVRGAIRIQMELGIAHRNLGRWADAERLFREAREASQRLGIHFLSSGAGGHLAAILLQRGRLDEALALARSAVDASARSSNFIRAGVGRTTLAQILARHGDLDAALREAQDAVDALVVTPARAAGLAVLATVLLARGQGAEALRRAEEGAAILSNLGAIPDNEALLRLVHAETLAGAGRTDDARAVISVARARLLERARDLSDPVMRQTFFEEVDANRKTLELADALGRQGT